MFKKEIIVLKAKSKEGTRVTLWCSEHGDQKGDVCKECLESDLERGKRMAKKIIFGTECKHWESCEFRNDIGCDSEMCDEFEEQNDKNKKKFKCKKCGFEW